MDTLQKEGVSAVVDWTEIILCTYLYHHSFHLTNGNELPAKLQEQCDEYRETYL